MPLILLLLGCADRTQATPTAEEEAVIVSTPESRATPTPQPTVVLAATFTPLPRFPAVPTPDQTEEGPSEPSEQETPTPVSFDEIVVELRYMVPELGLERQLQGDMANRISMSDAATGVEAEYRNQGGVLLELRQALSGVELDNAHADCRSCVAIEYALSIEGETGQGWLHDEVLLASIENYMAVALGPHVPPDTVVALRRSASPYAPAHTIALTEDGNLWKWLATDDQIPQPTSHLTTTTRLRQLTEELLTEELAEHYVTACRGAPVETLVVASVSEQRSVSIVCPEYSIPSPLLPLYLLLDAEIAPYIADVSLPRPPSAFPLTALLDYQRADGRRLTLHHDGSLVALDADGSSFTKTLTTTQVVSVTNRLLQSGALQPGLSTFGVDATEPVTSTASTDEDGPTSVLVLRGVDGFYDGSWPADEAVEALASLNALLNEMLEIGSESEELPAVAGTPDAVGTVERDSPEPAGSATPTGVSPSPTPSP